MKINSREKKLLFVLSFFLWLWALKGTVGLYHAWQEATRPSPTPSQVSSEDKLPPPASRQLLEKILALEGGSLPWSAKEAGVNLLDFLRQKLQAADLALTRMSLAPLEKVGPHKLLPVQLEATGSAAGYLIFLHSLAQAPFACNVSALELVAREGQVEGRVGLEFYLLATQALSRQKEALLAQGAKGNPPLLQPLSYYFPQGLARAFAWGKQPTPEAEPAPEVIGEAPVLKPSEQLVAPPYQPNYQLLGIVYQSDKPMALLRNPAGETLLVGEGEQLGQELVVKIERQGVLLGRAGEEAWIHVTP